MKQLVETRESKTLFGDMYVQVPKVDRELLGKFMFETMKNYTVEQFVAVITNEVTEIFEYIALTQGQKAAQKTSLLFNPHRLDVTTIGSKDKRYKTILEALRHPAFYHGLARAVLFKQGSLKISELFYSTLGMGVEGAHFVYEFPPYAARDLAKGYGVSSKSIVLDPCAGWGGRMLGISCVADRYVCYEPATKTYQGLVKLYKFIKDFRPQFQAIIHNQPYEDSDESPESYDFALTSPPYFDTEKYSNEETQSFKRYPSFEKWAKGFYRPMIDKTMRQLKPGCSFVLNIADRLYPLSKTLRAMRYKTAEVRSYIPRAGLGREHEEGEKFWAVTK